MATIEALTSSQQEQIESEIDAWLNALRNTNRLERAALAAQIDQIYKTVTGHPPRIIWCQSPWQIAAVSFLLLAFKRSNLNKACQRWLRMQLNKPRWLSVWRIFDEYKNELEELLRQPLDNFLLNSQCAQNVEEHLNYPMKPERWQISEELLARFSEAAWADFSTRSQRFRRTLWRNLLIPIEGHVTEQIENDFGKGGLLKALESQIRSQFLSPEDQEKLERFRASSESQLKQRLRNRSLSLSQCKIVPLLSLQNGYLLKIFLASNLMDELRQTIGMLSWPWQEQLQLEIALASRFLDSEFQDLLQSHAEDIAFWKEFQQRCLVIMPTEALCLISDRPTHIQIDSRELLHDPDGPALCYADGFSFYRWHGIPVPEWVIEKPELITVERIDNELNSEIRRALIERYGESRYLSDSGAEAVAQDEYGILYRKTWNDDNEDLVMVKVLNSTVNADGTRSVYFLRVPPEFSSPKAAIAWTFGLEENEYLPDAES